MSFHLPPPPQAWADLPFFGSPADASIREALAAERRAVLPEAGAVFRALDLTPPGAVRAVILGQDPYPTPGHATGLAFAVPRGTRPPPSLANILRELEADLGAVPEGGDIAPWAGRGVLLLNTALTVPAGVPAGHARLGWEALAAAVLARVSARPTAFLLWGRPAQAMRRHIRGRDHLVLEAAHPSPLSARRGFHGSRPFSRTDAWLAARGEGPIGWTGGADPARPLP